MNHVNLTLTSVQLPALVGFSEAVDRGHLLGHIASMVGMDHTMENRIFSTYGETRLEPVEAGWPYPRFMLTASLTGASDPRR
jgi:hypothetical protein